MKILFIRHGEAVDITEVKDGNDLGRPLTKDGRKELKDIFKGLAKVYRIDAIFSSEAVRARETADILAKYVKGVKVIESGLLNPGCSISTFKTFLSKIANVYDRISVIGHEPDFSDIISELVSNGSLRIEIKKASCVEVEVNRIEKSYLRSLIPPKVFLK